MRRRGRRRRADTRWPFLAVAFTYLVMSAGPNVPTPLYAGYQRDFGFSPLVITLIFATYIATLIPSLLLAGPLSDAIGRRRVLVPAIAAAVAGSAVFAFADGTAWLYAARCLQGAAVGAASGALVARLVELEPAGDPHRAALAATIAPVAGIAAAPLLSGLLAEYAPAPYRTPYLVEIVLLAPALVAMAVLPEATRRARWRPRRPQVPAGIRGTFAISATTSFLAWAVTGLFLALVPSYVAELIDTSNLAIGGGVVTLMLGCSAVAQRLASGRTAESLQAAGIGLLVAGVLTLIAAGETASLPLLLAATVAAGAGQGLAYLGAMTEVNRIAPPDRHADIVSSFLVVTYLGSALSVIGVGLLATSIGLLAAVERFLVVVAVLCMLLLVVLARAARAARRAPPPPPSRTSPPDHATKEPPCRSSFPRASASPSTSASTSTPSAPTTGTCPSSPPRSSREGSSTSR